MADDTTDTTATTTTSTETTTAQVPKTFTQEEMNTIIGQRLAEDRARRPKAEAPKPPANGDDLRGELEELKLRNAFDKRVARLDLKPDAEEDLFTLFKAQKPQDPEVWVKSKVETLGLKPSTPTIPGTAQAAAAPAAAPSAPSKVDPITTHGGLINILELPDEQFQQLKATGQLRSTWEKFIDAGHRQQGAPRPPKALTRK